MFSRFVNLDLFYLLEFLIWELSVLHYEEGDICTWHPLFSPFGYVSYFIEQGKLEKG